MDTYIIRQMVKQAGYERINIHGLLCFLHFSSSTPLLYAVTSELFASMQRADKLYTKRYKLKVL
jgi:hypothetical protein